MRYTLRRVADWLRYGRDGRIKRTANGLFAIDGDPAAYVSRRHALGSPFLPKEDH
jgi:hypothetical protein